MISSVQAIRIACPFLTHESLDRASVYPTEYEMLFHIKSDNIYGYQNIRRKWDMKDAWFVVHPQGEQFMIASSCCTVVDKKSEEILASFSLNDEG